MGAYLVDDDNLRIVVQSESYGPLYYESYPYPVNDGTATFTGSHVQYTDFNREGLTDFLTHDNPASDIITGFGQVSHTYYNLAGELVGPRDPNGPTAYGAHFSNTDKDGNYAVASVPSQADWLMQSLCSSHLEEKHQWGKGIGLEDDMYITNEEWITCKYDQINDYNLRHSNNVMKLSKRLSFLLFILNCRRSRSRICGNFYACYGSCKWC